MQHNSFCELFTEDEVLIYEYVQDLDDYYTEGYGSGIGYEIAAALLQVCAYACTCRFMRARMQVCAGVHTDMRTHVCESDVCACRGGMH